MEPCKTLGCENTVSKSMRDGFCFSCLAELQRQYMELKNDLDKVLALEAEFVEWCAEHGKPHPHE